MVELSNETIQSPFLLTSFGLLFNVQVEVLLKLFSCFIFARTDAYRRILSGSGTLPHCHESKRGERYCGRHRWLCAAWCWTETRHKVCSFLCTSKVRSYSAFFWVSSITFIIIMLACRSLAKPVPELNPEEKWAEILARQDVEVKSEFNESREDVSVSSNGKELPLIKDANGQEVSDRVMSVLRLTRILLDKAPDTALNWPLIWCYKSMCEHITPLNA